MVQRNEWITDLWILDWIVRERVDYSGPSLDVCLSAAVYAQRFDGRHGVTRCPTITFRYTVQRRTLSTPGKMYAFHASDIESTRLYREKPTRRCCLYRKYGLADGNDRGRSNVLLSINPKYHGCSTNACWSPDILLSLADPYPNFLGNSPRLPPPPFPSPSLRWATIARTTRDWLRPLGTNVVPTPTGEGRAVCPAASCQRTETEGRLDDKWTISGRFGTLHLVPLPDATEDASCLFRFFRR